MMHFWSKFGKPHFIWFWLIARTNSQAQNGVNLDFQAQFDLEDHCQSPHKTIGILIKVFYISDPNLVILAWTVDELSHGQAHDWRTHRHTHTHTHTQATTIPEGQNWPRVKIGNRQTTPNPERQQHNLPSKKPKPNYERRHKETPKRTGKITKRSRSS